MSMMFSVTKMLQWLIFMLGFDIIIIIIPSLTSCKGVTGQLLKAFAVKHALDEPKMDPEKIE